jgi:hypothetical protein
MLDENQERINDTTKLIMHRLIARALRDEPLLVDDAKSALAGMSLRFPGSPFVSRWQKLLDLSIDDLRARMTSRDRKMAWLRLSSPSVIADGVDFTEISFRRRMRRALRRIVGLSAARQPRSYASGQ